jgi:3-oxoacyl-[acyl-carrier-protein] synthase III
VGRQVNEAFYKEIGLDYRKEFTIYKQYGNLVSSALPTAFFKGIKEKPVAVGEKVLLLGFGSGLNSIFTGIEW